MKFTICISMLVALLSVRTIAGQENPPPPPKCVSDLAAKPDFMECLTGFMGYLKNLGETGGLADNQTSLMKDVICSTEGKAAIGCMMPFIKQCPELSQQTGAVDFSQLKIPDAGLEAACDLITGPCSAIQECLQLAPMAGGDPGMEAEMSAGGSVTMMNINPFAYFVQQAAAICGPMKKQFDCIRKHLTDCKPQVTEIEKSMQTSIEMGMKEGPVMKDKAVLTYDDFITFMDTQCMNSPKDFGKDACIMRTLTGPTFTECYQNASDTYKMAQGKTCSLYNMQSKCLDTTVGSECGEQHAAFLKANMNLIIQNVAASCTDTSAANRNVNIAATTFIMLAVSLAFVF